MANIGDNIEAMTEMVASLKSRYKNRISEGTILRIVEISLAMAQNERNQSSFPTDDIPLPDETDPAVEAAVTADPTTEDA